MKKSQRDGEHKAGNYQLVAENSRTKSKSTKLKTKLERAVEDASMRIEAKRQRCRELMRRHTIPQGWDLDRSDIIGSEFEGDGAVVSNDN